MRVLGAGYWMPDVMGASPTSSSIVTIWFPLSLTVHLPSCLLRYGVKANPEAGLSHEVEAYKPSSTTEPLSLTQPQPFKLTTDARAKGHGRAVSAKAASAEPTMAEAIFKMQNAVIDRVRPERAVLC